MSEDDQARKRRKAFGAALGEAIAVRGVTQRELGRLLGGMTQSAISAWKSGEAEPSTATVFAVERRLELPPGHLSRHLGYLPITTDRAASTFEEVVLGDPLLDEVQKRGLLALYREFLGRDGSRAAAAPPGGTA
jgi:transcriptional regulator with XRE-family HTH domain